MDLTPTFQKFNTFGKLELFIAVEREKFIFTTEPFQDLSPLDKSRMIAEYDLIGVPGPRSTFFDESVMHRITMDVSDYIGKILIVCYLPSFKIRDKETSLYLEYILLNACV